MANAGGKAILSVDVGSVRIGIALCEHRDLPAMPLETILHRSRAEDVAAIVALARARGAATIVVGYPLRLNGTRGAASQKVDRFLDALRAAFNGDVAAIDERLTTAAAAKKLAAGGLSGSKRRRIVDRLAAVEILESYLAQLRRAAPATADRDGE